MKCPLPVVLFALLPACDTTAFLDLLDDFAPGAEAVEPRSVSVDPCAAAHLAFVEIPAGTAVLGSPTTEVGHQSNEGWGAITLSHGLLLGAVEMPASFYEECSGDLPTWSRSLPVSTVSYGDAAMLANEVSAAEGLPLCFVCEGEGDGLSCTLDPAWETPYDCPGYRLPTQAEHEYAARAGSTSAIHGDANLVADASYNCSGSAILDDGADLGDLARYCGNSDGADLSGLYASNAFGVYDLNGNLSEWTMDGWSSAPFPAEDGLVDPWVPVLADGFAVVKDGSFKDVPAAHRYAHRGFLGVNSASTAVGFRLARTIL